MVKSRRAFFKYRRDQDDPELLGDFPQARGGRPGDFFGELKIFVILGLTKINRIKDLLETDDIGSLRSRLADHCFRFVYVFKRIDQTSHLDQADFQHGVY